MTRPEPHLDSFRYSHPGLQRTRNEDDAVLVRMSPDCLLLAVADGIGGHTDGERCSQLALAVISESVLRARSGEPPADDRGALLEGFRAANMAIDEAGLKGGSTATVALVHRTSVTIGHLGDSRAYLVRGKTARLLTSDHAADGGLLRWVGKKVPDDAECCALDVSDGDSIVLCSDGLTKVVRDDEVALFVRGSAHAAAACVSLVDLACRRGGPDNVTVAVVRIGEIPPDLAARSAMEALLAPPASHQAGHDPTSGQCGRPRRTPGSAFILVLLLTLTLGSGAFAGWRLSRTTFPWAGGTEEARRRGRRTRLDRSPVVSGQPSPPPTLPPTLEGNAPAATGHDLPTELTVPATLSVEQDAGVRLGGGRSIKQPAGKRQRPSRPYLPHAGAPSVPRELVP